MAVRMYVCICGVVVYMPLRATDLVSDEKNSVYGMLKCSILSVNELGDIAGVGACGRGSEFAVDG